MEEEGVRRKKRMMIFMATALFIVALIISGVNLMKYNQKKKEAERLALELEEKQGRVDELKYRLSSPIDDAYVEKVAREKFGLHFPDEIIYFYGK